MSFERKTRRMPPGKKESGSQNAAAAFHHVVAKGDLERVKDFVLVSSVCHLHFLPPPALLPCRPQARTLA